MGTLAFPQICQLFLAHLSDLMGGTAKPELARSLMAHRAACSSCDGEFLLARCIERGLATLPEFAPHGLIERIQGRLAAPEVARA